MITGLAHSGYTVSNLERAVAFFGETLGIEHTRMQVSDQPYLERVTGLPGANMKIGFVQAEGDNSALELLEFVQPKGQPAGVSFGRVGTFSVGWSVDSLPAAFERLSGQGVKFLAEPHQVGDGPWGDAAGAFLLGPDGSLIELVELAGSGGGRGRLTGMHHTTWTVSSLDAALTFLSEGLEFTVIARHKGDSAYARQVGDLEDGHLQAVYLAIPSTDHMLKVVEFRNPAGPPIDPGVNNPGGGHFCLLTDDIWADQEALSAQGARFVGPPAEVTAGVNQGAYAIHFDGPDAFRFELFQGPPTRVAD